MPQDVGRNGGMEARPVRPGIFREEAIRRHLEARQLGDVLRLPPRWTRFAYPLVVGATLVGMSLLCVARVKQYARGPAVVRAEAGRTTVVAMFPAAFLPELRAGMPLRVDLPGHPRGGVDAVIESLDDRALGAAEARAAVGSRLSGTVEVPGPVVLARASLPAASLQSDARDGMVGSAETQVRSERLIFALFPGLRSALAD